MDAQQQYLVYQQSESPPSIQIPRSGQLHLAAAIAESQWHHSPTSNSPSAVSSQMYPILNRSSEMVDYTSSSPSSSFGPLDFHAGHQSPSIQTNHPNNAFPVDFAPQVESSIGPTRGAITRRRTRIAHANQPGGLSRCTEPEAERHPQQMYLMPPASGSRPQTPNNFIESNRFQQQPSTPLNTIHTQNNLRLLSPTVHASGQSFEHWTPDGQLHNRSRSTSASDLRSASPAMSVASALTSVSSSHSGQKGHSFPPLAQPSNLLPDEPRQKFRKMRLFNGDRKRMCIEHLEHPDWKQEKLAKRFSVERSTVSKILKHKDKWMNVPDADINRVAKHRPSKFPGIESRLIVKLRQISQDGTLLSDSLIRANAREVAQNLEIHDEKFKASSGWVDNFKSRWGIRRGIMTKGIEEAMNTNGTPKCIDDSAVSPPKIALRASYPGAEMDNGVESEDSPAASPVPLQPAWSSDNPHTALYEPKQGSGVVVPDLAEAEQAVDVVLTFVDAQGEGWVTNAERTALQHVKLLLVQTGQGLPYHREY